MLSCSNCINTCSATKLVSMWIFCLGQQPLSRKQFTNNKGRRWMACQSAGSMQCNILQCCIPALSAAGFMVWIAACDLLGSFTFWLRAYAFVVTDLFIVRMYKICLSLRIRAYTKSWNLLPTFESIILYFMHSVLGKSVLYFLMLASCLRTSSFLRLRDKEININQLITLKSFCLLSLSTRSFAQQHGSKED